MKLIDLLKGVNYDGEIPIEIQVDKITYDSRKVEKGSCFVAIKGHIADGNEYIQSAINNGASLAITDQSNENFEVPLIKVSNARKALSRISSNLYGNPSENINAVGITGTNGKTTTKGGVTQLNLHDGRNILVDNSNKYNTRDSLVIDVNSQKIKSHLKFEDGANCYLIGGSHIGSTANIKEYSVKRSSKDNEVIFENFGTIEDHVFIVGDFSLPISEVSS